MITSFFSNTLAAANKQNKEGELYKIVNIKGKIFELRYGYYEDIDRSHSEPDIIYPDLNAEPQYTSCGMKIVTQMQDACKHFEGNKNPESDCSQCAHFERDKDLFGICRCLSAPRQSKK